MKKLANLITRFSRSRDTSEDFFETRLKSLGKPQPGKRPTRAPRPVLFRRSALQ